MITGIIGFIVTELKRMTMIRVDLSFWKEFIMECVRQWDWDNGSGILAGIAGRFLGNH
jgi:hypothetical protein